MDNPQNDVKGPGTETGLQNNKMKLPLIAFGLSVLPVLLIFLFRLAMLFPALSRGFDMFFLPVLLIVILLSPVAGLITGIVALSKGKAHIGTWGIVIAIVAIALPLVYVAIIIHQVVGIMTGQISLM